MNQRRRITTIFRTATLALIVLLFPDLARAQATMPEYSVKQAIADYIMGEKTLEELYNDGYTLFVETLDTNNNGTLDISDLDRNGDGGIDVADILYAVSARAAMRVTCPMPEGAYRFELIEGGASVDIPLQFSSPLPEQTTITWTITPTSPAAGVVYDADDLFAAAISPQYISYSSASQADIIGPAFDQDQTLQVGQGAEKVIVTALQASEDVEIEKEERFFITFHADVNKDGTPEFLTAYPIYILDNDAEWDLSYEGVAGETVRLGTLDIINGSAFTFHSDGTGVLPQASNVNGNSVTSSISVTLEDGSTENVPASEVTFNLSSSPKSDNDMTLRNTAEGHDYTLPVGLNSEFTSQFTLTLPQANLNDPEAELLEGFGSQTWTGDSTVDLDGDGSGSDAVTFDIMVFLTKRPVP